MHIKVTDQQFELKLLFSHFRKLIERAISLAIMEEESAPLKGLQPSGFISQMKAFKL
jgi:hypothetical protein